MILWQIFAICGIAFLILEMFTPSMFFLNFSLASFICAVLSLYTKNSYVLVIAFFIFSFVSFWFLRPIIMKKLNKSQETGINSKYINKIAKAETEITSTSGVISIYGERWEARSEDSQVIPQGSDIIILRNESIIMYVQDANK
jgi:membrane protein implicated in regulation of membrane protease activity